MSLLLTEEDKIRKTFGKWVLVKEVKKTKQYKRRWLCHCLCGRESIVHEEALKKGTSTQCQSCAVKQRSSHNMSRSKTYSVRVQMIERCHRPTHKWYRNYGAKGITVCKRWLESFENFLEDMGEAPEGHSIERLDNYKGYYKENCVWATRSQQNSNKRNSIRIGDIYNGWKVTEKHPKKKYTLECQKCLEKFLILSCNVKMKKEHRYGKCDPRTKQ